MTYEIFFLDLRTVICYHLIMSKSKKVKQTLGQGVGAGAEDFDRLLTRKQVAEMLQVCPHTVRNLELRGSLPRVEISRVGVRYTKADVDDFIAQRRVKALW